MKWKKPDETQVLEYGKRYLVCTNKGLVYVDTWEKNKEDDIARAIEEDLVIPARILSMGGHFSRERNNRYGGSCFREIMLYYCDIPELPPDVNNTEGIIRRYEQKIKELNEKINKLRKGAGI